MRDDVVLSRLDRRLGRVGVVAVGFHISFCGVLCLQEILDGTGVFIVKYVEYGYVPDRLQV